MQTLSGLRLPLSPIGLPRVRRPTLTPQQKSPSGILCPLGIPCRPVPGSGSKKRPNRRTSLAGVSGGSASCAASEKRTSPARRPTAERETAFSVGTMLAYEPFVMLLETSRTTIVDA